MRQSVISNDFIRRLYIGVGSIAVRPLTIRTNFNSLFFFVYSKIEDNWFTKIDCLNFQKPYSIKSTGFWSCDHIHFTVHQIYANKLNTRWQCFICFYSHFARYNCKHGLVKYYYQYQTASMYSVAWISTPQVL